MLDRNVQSSLVIRRLGVNLLALGQQRLDDVDVPLLGCDVDAAGAVLVRHQQRHALVEQQHRRLGVAVDGRYVHQRAAVLSAVVDGGFELLNQKVHQPKMTSG